MNADMKLLCPVYKGREISSGGVGFREWGIASVLIASVQRTLNYKRREEINQYARGG